MQKARQTAYLVNSEEEQSINQDTPDGNVGKDACWQGVGINGDGSIGVQSNESPCQWSSDCRGMNESSVCIVAEVCSREIEEVYNQKNFSPEEVGANEEHDESEV